MTHNSRTIVDRVSRYASTVASWVSSESEAPSVGTSSIGTSSGGASRDEAGKRLAADGGKSVTDSRDADTSAGATPAERSTASTGATDPTEATTRTEVQLDLGLTLEEFVVALLEERDGRLKQSALVDRLDWSKATVSRLLRDMEDDDRIVRIEIGREKTVYFPDQAPGRDPFARVDGDEVPTA